LKFEAVAEKTEKDAKGLLYFSAPCTVRVNVRVKVVDIRHNGVSVTATLLHELATLGYYAYG